MIKCLRFPRKRVATRKLVMTNEVFVTPKVVTTREIEAIPLGLTISYWGSKSLRNQVKARSRGNTFTLSHISNSVRSAQRVFTNQPSDMIPVLMIIFREDPPWRPKIIGLEAKEKAWNASLCSSSLATTKKGKAKNPYSTA